MPYLNYNYQTLASENPAAFEAQKTFFFQYRTFILEGIEAVGNLVEQKVFAGKLTDWELFKANFINEDKWLEEVQESAGSRSAKLREKISK